MNAIVTGANGYIGSYLVKVLVEKGFNTFAISRKFHEGVKSLNANFITHDIVTLPHPSIEQKIDYYFHLASANDLVSKNFVDGVNLSLYGTQNAVEYCLANEIKNFIFYSTLQVLGTELQGEYMDNSPAKIESNYAYNHFVVEEYLKMISNKNDINILIVRPSNIYGAMLDKNIDRWSLVPNCFCKEGVEKNSITLLSSGNQNRNFLSASQVANLSIYLAKKYKQEKFKIINYGYKENFSIKQIAIWTKEVFEEHFGINIKLEIKSELPMFGNDFKIDNSSYSEWLKDQEVSEYTFKNEIKNIINLINN